MGGFDSLLLPPVLIPFPRRFLAITAINLMVQMFVFGHIESVSGAIIIPTVNR